MVARTGAQSVSGLSSGIDWKSLVDSMIEIDGSTTRLAEKRQKTVQTRLDAVRSLSSKLLAAQIDSGSLKLTSTFASRTATSSNQSVLTATAGISASPGVYTVTVEQKAQAQQLATGGFTSSSSAIGTGTVTIQVGNGAATTVTVGSGNATLDGLAAAINGATGSGVTAAVINDGSASPYRLVLTAKDTGAANIIKLDASGLSGVTPNPFAPVTPTGGNTYAGTATLAGAWNGANFPSTAQVRVKAAGGGDQSTAQFEMSVNGGGAWSDVVNSAGTLALGNGLTMTVGAGTLAAGDAFTLRPMQELAAAKDARLKYGQGAGAITITNATNAITGLIPGVTLNLAGESPSAVTITVGNDSSKAVAAVATMVESVNKAVQFMRDNGSYDPVKKAAGILFSDTDVRRAVDAVVRGFTQAIPGLPAALRDGTSIGIDIDRSTGLLTLDTTKLEDKLAADPEAVRKLFNNTGTSTSATISFLSVGDKTKTTSPFAVAITQAAEQAASTSSVLGLTTIIASGSQSLGVTVNGRAYAVSLNAGDYTREQLADHVQRTVNASVQRGDEVVVGVDTAGSLTMKSRSFGSSQTLQLSATSAVTTLGFATTLSTGKDVKGTINGGAEITGRGQVLTGTAGTTAEGLNLLVTSTTTIPSASVTAIKGLGQLMSEQLTALTKTATGSVSVKADGLQKTIDSLGEQITKMNERLAARKNRYLAQFQNMERVIGQFQSQGNSLSGAIKGFENAATARSNG